MTPEQATHDVTVNAAEQDHRIESVTVFQSTAEIKRRVNLDLKQGQNQVHIERLPSCINEDSVRVDGTGNAVIFDVVYHGPTARPVNSKDEAVAAAQRSLEVLQKERDVAREQAEFLSAYGRTLDTKNINVEDVQRFLDMFAPRQVAVAKRIQELDIEIQQVEEEVRTAREKVFEDDQRDERRAKISVTVLAETDGTAELMLTYVVTDASWRPLYDIRASIPKSTEATSTVSLHYRASITQQSGENWPDVGLTLSTATPQLGSGVPTLTSWRIGPPSPDVPRSRGPRTKQTARKSAAIEELDLPFYAMGFAASCEPAMAVRQAQVAHAGVLNATFGIPGHSDIPSDAGEHKVVITVLELEAELEWLCVPREKESVFLICKIANASEFTLLPGDASVFMDDNFVSKTQIEHVSPNDSFKTSLGVDSALRVTYPPAKTLNRTGGQSSFFLAKEKHTVSAQSQRITIRNSRPAAVSALRVLDHVPVSTDARIKVNVIMPKGLDSTISTVVPTSPTVETADEGKGKGKEKERPWAALQKGVRARWAPLDAGGEGTVEWNCEIEPSEEVELELSWEVSAPVGQSWENV